MKNMSTVENALNLYRKTSVKIDPNDAFYPIKFFRENTHPYRIVDFFLLPSGLKKNCFLHRKTLHEVRVFVAVYERVYDTVDEYFQLG